MFSLPNNLITNITTVVGGVIQDCMPLILITGAVFIAGYLLQKMLIKEE